MEVLAHARDSMSSIRLSDSIPAQCNDKYDQQESLASTPQTPLSPEDTFASNGDLKTFRNNSCVRFQGVQTLSGDEDQSSRVKSSQQSNLPPSYQPGVGNHSDQYHPQVLSRIKALEKKLDNLEFSRNPASPREGDESSERTGLSTEIQWMTWQEYLEDASKASSILEVLGEKPHTNSRRTNVKPILEIPPKINSKVPPDPQKNIERIRIRSFHIINALQIVTEQTFASSSRLIIHRPFKMLLFYHEQISDYLAELEHDFEQNTHCHLGTQCKGYVDFDDGMLNFPVSPGAGRVRTRGQSVERSPHSLPYTSLATDTGDEECKHEVSEELLAQQEAITHLRILVNFMKEDMKHIFAKHEHLRSSKAGKIAFQDVWHLFMAGDLVVAEDEDSGKGEEIFQVSVLPACDIFSSRRPVKQIQARTEGSQHLIESVYNTESINALSVFTVDVFYFDFDGHKFGPVERRMQLVSWEGEKSIVDLPFYPLRFRQDARHFKKMVLERVSTFLRHDNVLDYSERSSAARDGKLRSLCSLPSASFVMSSS